MTQTAIPVFAAPDAPGMPTSDRSAWQRAMLTSGLRPATKLVALAVSVHAAPTPPAGSPGANIAACAPGLAALVDEVGYSRSHVLRQIRLLRDHCWLTVVGRPAPGRSTVYGLTLPAAAEPPPRPARIVSDAPSRAARHRRATRGRIPTAALDALGSTPVRASGLVDLLDGMATGPVQPSAGASAQSSAEAPGRAAADPPAAAATTDVSPRPGAVAPAAPVPSAPAAPAQPRAGRVSQVPLPGTSAPAAAQVIAALARALRCDPRALGGLIGTVCDILDAGDWPAVELAAHLADGVPVTVDEPAALLDARIDGLPSAPGACGCRPCVSLRPAASRGRAGTAPTPTGSQNPTPAGAAGPAAPARVSRPSPTPAARPTRRRPAAVAAAASAPAQAQAQATAPAGAAAVTRPDLAAIERAAAAGAAQARHRRDTTDR